MPHPFLKAYRPEIKKYCEANSLSVDKVFSASSAGNKSEMILQHFDPDDGKLGLLDETPMPITLKIYLEKDKLRFEQTEYTQKYLGATQHAVAV